jgi:sarcosine oxidase, subunit gamma
MLEAADPPVVPDAGIAAAKVEIRPALSASRFIFRGGDEAVRLCGSAFGVALPRNACRSAQAGSRSALWLGPDEWLLLESDGESEAIETDLRAALGSAPHSLVDIGHRNVGLLVSGEASPDLLNAGCPLDLDIGAFPVGMCTRTLFGKAEIVLWRIELLAFRVEAWRSFVPYVEGLLAEAAREYAA